MGLEIAHNEVPLRYAQTASNGFAWGLRASEFVTGETPPYNGGIWVESALQQGVFGRAIDFAQMTQTVINQTISYSLGLIETLATSVTDVLAAAGSTIRTVNATIWGKAIDPLSRLIQGRAASPVYADVSVSIPGDAFILSFDLQTIRSAPGEHLLVALGDSVVASIPLTAMYGRGGVTQEIWIEEYAGHEHRLRFLMPSDGPSSAEFVIANVRVGRWVETVGSGVPIAATSSTTGQHTAVQVENDGHTIAFQEVSGGQWRRVNLSTSTGSPVVTAATAWVDPGTGVEHIAGLSSAGVALFRKTGNTSWEWTNLTTTVSGASAITSGLTSFISQDGRVFVAGLNAQGQVVLYTFGFDLSQGSRVWTFVNLSESHLAPKGLGTPGFVGPLISYVTAWNGLNIAGLDAVGNIWSVWSGDGGLVWYANNLSTITGAPPISGGLTAYLTSWDGINLAGLSASGQLVVTWWVPGFGGGNWVISNLTELIGGPDLEPGSLASYVTSWGGLNVVGRRGDGHTIVYWWAPGIADDRWVATPISEFIEGAPLFAGPVTGIASPVGTISLFGEASDGDLLRYWWKPGLGGDWRFENITEIAT